MIGTNLDQCQDVIGGTFRDAVGRMLVRTKSLACKKQEIARLNPPVDPNKNPTAAVKTQANGG